MFGRFTMKMCLSIILDPILNPIMCRPSIFEMHSINGSVSKLNTIEFNEIGEYEFDPSDKRFNSSNRSGQFHTVSAPHHESVFNGIRQDALRDKQQRVVSEGWLKTKKEACPVIVKFARYNKPFK